MFLIRTKNTSVNLELDLRHRAAQTLGVLLRGEGWYLEDAAGLHCNTTQTSEYEAGNEVQLAFKLTDNIRTYKSVSQTKFL